jgi:hypothetical protein
MTFGVLLSRKELFKALRLTVLSLNIECGYNVVGLFDIQDAWMAS